MGSTTAPETRTVVAILAANSQQSSSIITYLLSQTSDVLQHFQLRAIVRDPKKYTVSVSGGELAGETKENSVVEVVAGDMTDVNSLKKAFDGADVVWAMTNSDPSGGPEAELQFGKNIVDAFLEANAARSSRFDKTGLKPLLIMSSGIDPTNLTNGKIKMINAAGKAMIESYVHTLPMTVQQSFRCTFVHPGMLMQNFVTYQKPPVDDKGTYHFRASVRPDVQIPFVDITDLGPLVYDLLQKAFPRVGSSELYDEYDRATIRLFGEYLSYPQLVAQFSQATGESAVYDYLRHEDFLAETFGVTPQDAVAQLKARDAGEGGETPVTMIGDMYRLINEYGYFGGVFANDDRDSRTRKIVLQQTTRRTSWMDFAQAQWVKSDGGKVPKTSPLTANLTLPANFPNHHDCLAPAERFLHNWITYFLRGSAKEPFANQEEASDFEQAMIKPWFADDAIVEFPYFPKSMRESRKLQPLLSDPEEDGVKLQGHDEIKAYFNDWRHVFWFRKGGIKSLASLSPAKTSVSAPATTVGGAVIEIRMDGQLSFAPDKAYAQDYVSYAYVNDQGKVVLYREYWAADRFN